MPFPRRGRSPRRALASLLVVLGTCAGMVLLTPSVALACSCVRSSVADQVDRADTVVGGELEWATTNGLERTYSLKVDEVYKGVSGIREKIVSPASDAACGLGELATGERYVFFIHGRHPGRMTVDLCGGSTTYTDDVVLQVQAKTKGPFEPLPTFGDTPPPDEGGTDLVRIVGIGAFVVAFGVGAVALVRRKRTGVDRPRR